MSGAREVPHEKQNLNRRSSVSPAKSFQDSKQKSEKQTVKHYYNSAPPRPSPNSRPNPNPLTSPRRGRKKRSSRRTSRRSQRSVQPSVDSNLVERSRELLRQATASDARVMPPPAARAAKKAPPNYQLDSPGSMSTSSRSRSKTKVVATSVESYHRPPDGKVDRRIRTDVSVEERARITQESQQRQTRRIKRKRVQEEKQKTTARADKAREKYNNMSAEEKAALNKKRRERRAAKKAATSSSASVSFCRLCSNSGLGVLMQQQAINREAGENEREELLKLSFKASREAEQSRLNILSNYLSQRSSASVSGTRGGGRPRSTPSMN